jgi:PPP family 3-phenylpropionic acid transporter
LRNARRAVSVQYFAYFATLGVFLPYFTLYLDHLGLNGPQIGAVTGIRALMLVICPLLWSAWADRYGDRRATYLLATAASAGVWALFLSTERFGWLLLISAAHGAVFAPVISFLETFAVDALGARKERYGRLRAWGSLSFILVVLLLGRALDRVSPAIVVTLVLIGSVLQWVSAFGLPAAAVRTLRPPHHPPRRGGMPRRMAAFLGCGFLMLASHGAYYGFFSIHLSRLEYSGGFIGVCWALASASEIVVMLCSESIFRRYTLERILILALALAVLRWLALYAVSAPALILLAQPLHAATYGLFHMASILYVDRLTPPAWKTTGQALNNAASYGLGLMVGFFLSGALSARIGLPALFLGSALAALAGLLVMLVSLRRTTA